jgi:Ca2+-binding EF-hand superfamily protein
MGKFVPITEETLRLKKHYFDEINIALRKAKKSFRDLYRHADEDGCRDLNREELFTMFKKMSLSLTRDQSDQIFSTMDFDNNGTISEPELQADFQKVVSKSIEDLIYEQKSLRKLQEAEARREIDFNAGVEGFMQGEHKVS